MHAITDHVRDASVQRDFFSMVWLFFLSPATVLQPNTFLYLHRQFAGLKTSLYLRSPSALCQADLLEAAGKHFNILSVRNKAS